MGEIRTRQSSGTNKIKSLPEVKRIAQRFRKDHKTVGLITGCFDILHMGHINLFRFAKGHVDVLIVGLDNDESIRRTKGENRPINNLKKRLDFMSELKSVDYVFPINNTYSFGSSNADRIHVSILTKLQPTHLFTHGHRDRYWKNKMERAKLMGIKFMLDRNNQADSTGTIITKLESEL